MNDIAVIVLPNTGKTTLFNQWTHQSLPVANWSGVTVSLSKGQAYFDSSLVFLDLPGIYSLCFQNISSLPEDAIITHKYLKNNQNTTIVNVVDVRYLVRDLYLTTQLVALGRPMIVVINFSEHYPHTEELQSWLTSTLGIDSITYDDATKQVNKLNKMIHGAKKPDASFLIT